MSPGRASRTRTVGLLLLFAGCSQTAWGPLRQPTLLFDRLPCGISAEQYAARSELHWSLPQTYDGPESYYREYFYDNQGGNYQHRDHYWRRTRTVRWGRGYR